MIRRPLLSHYNAPYRGPKDKDKINAALNSIKIDNLNLSKYALYVSSKAAFTIKHFLIGEDIQEYDKIGDALIVSRVINNNVEVISSNGMMSIQDANITISECESQLEFMRNNINRKYDI